MEDAIVAALADEGIAARSRPQDGPDYTGVWVEDRKIASLGVHVSRGVTTHGFAVNVENDLDAVLVGGRLRPAGRDHDLDRGRARALTGHRATYRDARRPHRCDAAAASAGAQRMPLRGPRPPPAAGVAATAGLGAVPREVASAVPAPPRPPVPA